jgi:TfoX/Sxy family transcriptional regulator of competence genes
MFGNVAAFVNGNMFMGLFGPEVGLKLDESARAELESVEGTGPFGPAERPMGQYVALPPAWRHEPDLTEAWILRSLDHVGAMPPKKGRSKK